MKQAFENEKSYEKALPKNQDKFFLFKNKDSIGLLLCIILISSVAKFIEDMFSPMTMQITSDLGVTKNIIQRSASIYFTGFVFGVLFFGLISDIIGRKICVILGFIFIGLGITIMSFSSDMNYFFLSKFIQGMGASISSVLSQSISRDVFEGKALSKAYANMSYGSFVFSILGPIIGGQLANYLHWRESFYVMIPLIILSIIFNLYLLPETNPNSLGWNTSVKLLKEKLKSKITLLIITIRSTILDPNLFFRFVLIGMCGSITSVIMYESPFFYMGLLGLPTDTYSVCCLLNSLCFFFTGAISNKMIKTKTSLELISVMTKYTVVLSLIFFLGINMLRIHTTSAYSVNTVIVYFSVIMQISIMTCNTVASYNIMSSSFKSKDNVGISMCSFIAGYYSIITASTFLISSYSVPHLLSMPIMLLVLSVGISLIFWVCARTKRIY